MQMFAMIVNEDNWAQDPEDQREDQIRTFTYAMQGSKVRGLKVSVEFQKKEESYKSTST